MEMTCNNGSLAREKVKMDILVPSDYIFFFFLLITFRFWPFSLSQKPSGHLNITFFFKFEELTTYGPQFAT